MRRCEIWFELEKRRRKMNGELGIDCRSFSYGVGIDPPQTEQEPGL